MRPLRRRGRAAGRRPSADAARSARPSDSSAEYGRPAWLDSNAMATDGLAELHTHLGGSVSSDILWTLAHQQGIALPVKDYWDFDRLVTVSDPRGVPDLDALDAIYHWTELIQSSPRAVETSVHGAIGG